MDWILDNVIYIYIMDEFICIYTYNGCVYIMDVYIYNGWMYIYIMVGCKYIYI